MLAQQVNVRGRPVTGAGAIFNADAPANSREPRYLDDGRMMYDTAR
jgi:hypothetical protein